MAGYELQVHRDFGSRALPARNILVCVPPGYDSSRTRRYPVLYLQDGQNLFADAASPLSGRGWRLDITAATLIAEHAIEPLLLVGIPNMGEGRTAEYTPTFNAERRIGGKGALYGKLLVEEIKPFIDQSYRTLPEPQHTGLGGSSFGALIALYVGLHYPQVFGQLALLSLAVAWNLPALLELIEEAPMQHAPRIWLDAGTAEEAGIVKGTRAVRDALIARGWVLGSNLAYHEAPGARHTEEAWAQRVPLFLRYLFPASPNL